MCPKTNEFKAELSNFEVVSPQDMKSHWVTTGLGSANGEYFCLCCICRKDQKSEYKTGDEMCDCCKAHHGVERCYCWQVNDGKHLEEIEKLLGTYFEESKDNNFEVLKEIKEKTELEFDPTVADKERRAQHIDFQPRGQTERKNFKKAVIKEIIVRGTWIG